MAHEMETATTDNLSEIMNEALTAERRRYWREALWRAAIALMASAWTLAALRIGGAI